MKHKFTHTRLKNINETWKKAKTSQTRQKILEDSKKKLEKLMNQIGIKYVKYIKLYNNSNQNSKSSERLKQNYYANIKRYYKLGNETCDHYNKVNRSIYNHKMHIIKNFNRGMYLSKLRTT